MAIVKVQSNGKAPANSNVGDIVDTAGGAYLITGKNSDGTFQSKKITTNSIDKEIYESAALSSAISDANSAKSQNYAREQMQFNAGQSALTRDYNSAEAQKNRDWQEQMSNTAHQREVADLQAAGLNPILSANSGAAVGSGSSASANATTGASGMVDTAASSTAVDLIKTLINAKYQLQMNRESNATALQTSLNSARATEYAASASAGASMYASNMEKYLAQFNADHPETLRAYATRALQGAGAGPYEIGQFTKRNFSTFLKNLSAGPKVKIK